MSILVPALILLFQLNKIKYKSRVQLPKLILMKATLLAKAFLPSPLPMFNLTPILSPTTSLLFLLSLRTMYPTISHLLLLFCILPPAFRS
jgi:hypothetical protein